MAGRNRFRTGFDLSDLSTFDPTNIEDHTPNANTYATTAGNTSMRTMNMNAYNPQQQQPGGMRQNSRLQNTQKAGLGNGTSWGLGLPSSGGAAGGFGGALGGGIGGGGAPGLGQRPGQLSGFAQVMGGGGGQAPIDMSDFPSLSGGPQPSSNAVQSGWNSNVLRQPPAPQQPPQTQQRVNQPPPAPQQRVPSAAPSQQSIDQLEGQRSQQPSADQGGNGGSGDDFPPLSAQPNGDGFHSNGFGASLRSPESTLPHVNGQQTQLPFRDHSNILPQTQQAPIGQPSTQTPSTPQASQQPQQSTPSGQSQPRASGVKRYADMTETEKWGLEGLSAAYEARKNLESGLPVDETLPPIMRSAIFFGQDLSALGMDLDSLEPLYPTFTPFPTTNSSGSAFDFHDRHTIPDFQLPPAYTVTNVPPLAGRVAALSDETLFFIFYQMPRDIMQELAAQELNARDWRWHKLLRQWLQKDTREANASSGVQVLDLTQGTPVGVGPIRVSERVERGVYVFFDVQNWRRERREFVLNYDELDQRFAMGGIIQVANGGPVMPPAAGNGLGGAPGGAGVQSGMGSSGIPGAGS